MIGRMTPAGRFTLFHVSPASRVVGPLVEGPDGNVWFGEYVDGWIGRITPTGQIRVYRVARVPARNDGNNPGPYSIVVGPDGALWFTDVYGIGRITTSGTQRAYPVAPNGISPNSLALGADRALWFTNGNGFPWVGRMTTGGVVTILNLPDPSITYYQLTAQPDGTIWTSSNTVGRLVAIATSMALPATPGRDTTFRLICTADAVINSPAAAIAQLCSVSINALSSSTGTVTATLTAGHVTVASGSAPPNGPTLTIVLRRIRPIPPGEYRLTLRIPGVRTTTTIALIEHVRRKLARPRVAGRSANAWSTAASAAQRSRRGSSR